MIDLPPLPKPSVHLFMEGGHRLVQAGADGEPYWSADQMLSYAHDSVASLHHAKAEVDAALAEVKRVADLVKNTQPIWSGHLMTLCAALLAKEGA